MTMGGKLVRSIGLDAVGVMLDLSRFTFVETVQPGINLYTAVIWAVAL
ncbi:hypothetical protein H6F89_33425 [Cyanobacteria bacterium FACHB-63]|nr:hypothetical protein [Cyanobacteria bacterium FACHB-63]